MSKNPLDFCDEFKKELKNKLKNRQIKSATILIFILGCFFYSQAGNSVFAGVKAGSFSQEDKDIRSLAPQSLNLKATEELALRKNVQQESISPEILAKNNLEAEIRDITKNHPIEEMAPFIAQYEKNVAALIVGIAKKESNWGIHSPSKNGQVCYNYWGYKGAGSRGTALGYGCFATPQEAVEAIGNRIQNLAQKRIDTPQKMIVWKCGSSCAGHDPAGVSKWISDVSLYYNRVNKIAS